MPVTQEAQTVSPLGGFSKEQFERLKQEFHAPVLLPMMSEARFCSLAGFDPGVVRGWVARGYLPTVRVGKRSAVNLVALQKQLSNY